MKEILVGIYVYTAETFGLSSDDEVKPSTRLVPKGYNNQTEEVEYTNNLFPDWIEQYKETLVLDELDTLALTIKRGSPWHVQDVIDVNDRIVLAFDTTGDGDADTHRLYRVRNVSLGTGSQSGLQINAWSIDVDLTKYVWGWRSGEVEQVQQFRRNRDWTDETSTILRSVFNDGFGLPSIFEIRSSDVDSAFDGLIIHPQINSNTYAEIIELVRQSLADEHALNLEYELEYDFSANKIYLHFLEQRGGDADASLREISVYELVSDKTKLAANRLGSQIQNEQDDYVSRLIPTAGNPDDEEINVNDIIWIVESANGNVLTPEVGLIGFVDQFAGYYVSPKPAMGADRVFYPVVSNDMTTITYTGAAWPASTEMTLWERVGVDGSNNPIYVSLDYVRDPFHEDELGIVYRQEQLEAVPYDNEFEQSGGSPDFSTWSAVDPPQPTNLPDGLPNGMELFFEDGDTSPVVEQNDVRLYITKGNFSAKVTCATADTGVRCAMTLVPTELHPYTSVHATLQVEQGSVRMYIVDSEDKRFPPTNDPQHDGRATLTFALALEGADLSAGVAYVYLEAKTSDTIFYVDALTVTHSHTAWEYSAVMGRKALWQIAVNWLKRQGGAKPLTVNSTFLDLNYLEDSAVANPIHIGSHVRVKDLLEHVLQSDSTVDIETNADLDLRVQSIESSVNPFDGSFERVATLGRQRRTLIQDILQFRSARRPVPVIPASERDDSDGRPNVTISWNQLWNEDEQAYQFVFNWFTQWTGIRSIEFYVEIFADFELPEDIGVVRDGIPAWIREWDGVDSEGNDIYRWRQNPVFVRRFGADAVGESPDMDMDRIRAFVVGTGLRGDQELRFSQDSTTTFDEDSDDGFRLIVTVNGQGQSWEFINLTGRLQKAAQLTDKILGKTGRGDSTSSTSPKLGLLGAVESDQVSGNRVNAGTVDASTVRTHTLRINKEQGDDPENPGSMIDILGSITLNDEDPITAWSEVGGGSGLPDTTGASQSQSLKLINADLDAGWAATLVKREVYNMLKTIFSNSPSILIGAIDSQESFQFILRTTPASLGDIDAATLYVPVSNLLIAGSGINILPDEDSTAGTIDDDPDSIPNRLTIVNTRLGITSVEKTGGVTTITLTDGTTHTINDGQDGDDGEDGDDGDTPLGIQSISKTGGVTTITLTDSSTYTINDGEDGDDGDDAVFSLPNPITLIDGNNEGEFGGTSVGFIETVNGVVRRQSYLQDDELSIANLIPGQRAEIVLTPNSLQFEVNGQHVQASHVTIDATGITLGGVRRTTWPTGGGGGGTFTPTAENLYSAVLDLLDHEGSGISVTGGGTSSDRRIIIANTRTGGGIADVSGQGLYARIEDAEGNRNWSRLIIGSNLSISYGLDSGTPTWTLNADDQSGGGSSTDTTLTQEQVQDFVESLFTHGEHTGIAFAYDDANDRIEATVSATETPITTYNIPSIDLSPDPVIFCYEDLELRPGFDGAFLDTPNYRTVPFDVDITILVSAVVGERSVVLNYTSSIDSPTTTGIGDAITIAGDAFDDPNPDATIEFGEPSRLAFIVTTGTIIVNARSADPAADDEIRIDATTAFYPIKLISNSIQIVKSVDDLTIIDGLNGTVDISLSGHAGDSDIVISVESSDTTKMTVSPATLTFAEDDFDDPQTVTVTALADSLGTAGVNLSYTLEGKTWTDTVAVEIIDTAIFLRVQIRPVYDHVRRTGFDIADFIPWGGSVTKGVRMVDELLAGEVVTQDLTGRYYFFDLPFFYNTIITINSSNWNEWQDFIITVPTKSEAIEAYRAVGRTLFDPMRIRIRHGGGLNNSFTTNRQSTLIAFEQGNPSSHIYLVGTPVNLTLPANVTQGDTTDAGTLYTITPASNPVATEIEWQLADSSPTSGTITIPAGSVTPVTFLSEPDDLTAQTFPDRVRLTVSDPEVSQYQSASRVYLF